MFNNFKKIIVYLQNQNFMTLLHVMSHLNWNLEQN